MGMSTSATPLDCLSLEDSLGDIVISFPALLPTLHGHGFDYCCGGAKSLADACTDKGLVPGEVLAQLQDVLARGSGEGWADRSLKDLMFHIHNRFHVAHREQLPQLVYMARKVEQVHADKPDCPKGIADFLAEWELELEAHMDKEDGILFPMIAGGEGALAEGPISVMKADHETHGGQLETLRRLAHNYQPPAEACNTWRALYSGLDTFERDIMEHVHLENYVLFPRALTGENPDSTES